MVDTTCIAIAVPITAVSLATLAFYRSSRRKVINQISGLEKTIKQERDNTDPNKEYGKYHDLTRALQKLRESDYLHMITGYKARKDLKAVLAICKLNDIPYKE